MKEEIRSKLISQADEEYKKFNSSLCPNTDKDMFIGVRMPIIRKYAKELLKKYCVEDIVKNIGNDYYEEIILEGIIIATAKIKLEEKLVYVEKFVPKIVNWGICDTFCTSFKFKEEEKEVVWKFIKRYVNSEKEYETRFMLVMMLAHFIEEKHIDEILEIADKEKSDYYYVKMAVAWLISICYIKFKDKTAKYLKVCTLDDWTYNKAIQKIIESYRIEKSEKELLKKMKRK